jgi:hypothetical protein
LRRVASGLIIEKVRVAAMTGRLHVTKGLGLAARLDCAVQNGKSLARKPAHHAATKRGPRPHLHTSSF